MAIKDNQTVCFLCQTPCDQPCPHCKLVHYCCQDHFKLHRVTLQRDGSTTNCDTLEDQSEKRECCLPYKTENRPGIGRVLVATRTIKPMELVLVDPGSLTGPNYTSKPVCLECLLPVKGDYLCPTCEYPMCNVGCATGPTHSKECAILGRCPVSKRPKVLTVNADYNIETNAYSIITPLRMLLLQESNVDQWHRSDQLMDHYDDRVTNQEEWQWYEKNIVQYFHEDLRLGNTVTPKAIHRAIGLINVNAVALKFPSNCASVVPEGKGLYPIFAIGSHYCVCNARYTLDPETGFMYVRARGLIRLGEEISVQYLSALYGNFKRRKKIRDEWYFDCVCRRCSDPTECNTYVSAIKCSECIEGCLLPVNSLDYNSLWECRGYNGHNCDLKMSSAEVEALVDSIEDELNHINSSGQFERYATFVSRYSDTLLHPNHYLLMMAARNLIQWYTYKGGQLPEEALKQKAELCKQLDMVLGRIDPGYSEIRSFVQKELHFSLLLINQRNLEAGVVSRETYLETTRLSLKALDELDRYKRLIQFNCKLV